MVVVTKSKLEETLEKFEEKAKQVGSKIKEEFIRACKNPSNKENVAYAARVLATGTAATVGGYFAPGGDVAVVLATGLTGTFMSMYDVVTLALYSDIKKELKESNLPENDKKSLEKLAKKARLAALSAYGLPIIIATIPYVPSGHPAWYGIMALMAANALYATRGAALVVMHEEIVEKKIYRK